MGNNIHQGHYVQRWPDKGGNIHEHDTKNVQGKEDRSGQRKETHLKDKRTECKQNINQKGCQDLLRSMQSSMLYL